MIGGATLEAHFKILPLTSLASFPRKRERALLPLPVKVTVELKVVQFIVQVLQQFSNLRLVDTAVKFNVEHIIVGELLLYFNRQGL